MLAYKFLRPGAVGPFSGLSWPTPADGREADWVHAGDGDPMLCRAGVHACDGPDLPYWLCEELWVVELDGTVERRRSKLVATAGRLVERVERWDEAAALDFMCETVKAIRAMDRGGYATEAEIFCEGDAGRADPFGAAALSTMIAVEAAEQAGGHEAVRAERTRQAAWLAARLGIAAERD